MERNQWSQKIYDTQIKLAEEGQFDKMNAQMDIIKNDVIKKELQIAELRKELVEINNNIGSILI